MTFAYVQNYNPKQESKEIILKRKIFTQARKRFRQFRLGDIVMSLEYKKSGKVTNFIYGFKFVKWRKNFPCCIEVSFPDGQKELCIPHYLRRIKVK